MGVHTGDSITVAPAQTLTDREYQAMRNAALAILRAVGVETGGSNVQFALDPKTGRLVVVEMNPRVSRSSALASKATGFPIAKVAALLAVGYSLGEIDNDITRRTRAAFEPSIDYVVVKMPRFAFEKFRGAERSLSTQMKSVGEVMSIGRTFAEALGKAIRSLEVGVAGLGAEAISTAGCDRPPGTLDAELAHIETASPERIFVMADALRRGASVDEVALRSGVDPWFVAELLEIITVEQRLALLALGGGLSSLSAATLWDAKQAGLSDARIAVLLGSDEDLVFETRHGLGVIPSMKRVDTCAGEFEAHTPYLYSTYERPFYRIEDGRLGAVHACEARPTQRKKVLLLGGGPIRSRKLHARRYACSASTARPVLLSRFPRLL
jgi:carbamoyl-phosphate synthase large subunit